MVETIEQMKARWRDRANGCREIGERVRGAEIDLCASDLEAQLARLRALRDVIYHTNALFAGTDCDGCGNADDECRQAEANYALTIVRDLDAIVGRRE